ncbi:DUF2177 family protein [Candidatus Woesebacteria bacterium]|nr:DUF2177 family protein [Candidatus Woesebacteria bacterium]
MFLKLYAIALPVFFAIDMIWLGLVAKKFYAKYLGFIMSPTVNWPAALIFYLLFIVGIVIFVITPALKQQSLLNAALLGALFGLITYATYDLTNLATIKNWPLIVTVVDMIWGATLSTLISVITYLIAKKMGL